MKKFKIDLFSDTNTNPSLAMRQAMCEAEVGNEVAAEDPTVNKLLERVCDLLGKEAAVFLPSGTMCNGIAFRVLCERPGDLIILDETAHPLIKSSGLIAGLAQAQPYAIAGQRGIFSARQIESIITAPQGYNTSRPRVVSIEQTTNFGGGAIWPLPTIQEVCSLAHRYKVYTHMDGAHLLNAVVETGISAADYSSSFDSVWIDFSKSLGAPIGAVLAGSQSFIEEAWYYKFQQGGGLHQAGILAAGCLYGLEHHYQRLPEIHAYAKKLAKRLSELPFIKIDLDAVQTNIIIFEIKHHQHSAYHFEQALAEKGIRVLILDQTHIRMMTHLDISWSDIDEVYDSICEIAKK
ncbi:MAG: threonine aldolase family protein [Gammaproteobacteria bacterium]|nr:threonine aldolase family protein [Gammaproteobacteria bacterium]